MIETWPALKDWVMYEAKITTSLQLSAHTKFCEDPTRERARSFWAVHGCFEPVAWDSVMGIEPREA